MTDSTVEKNPKNSPCCTQCSVLSDIATNGCYRLYPRLSNRLRGLYPFLPQLRIPLVRLVVGQFGYKSSNGSLGLVVLQWFFLQIMFMSCQGLPGSQNCGTLISMHEMSLAASLVDIIRQEMKKNNATRLVKARVRCGLLSNVVPEALELAFEAVTRADRAKDTLENHTLVEAVLEIEEEPAILCCTLCNKEFSTNERKGIFSPCPNCGNQCGHKVVSGMELYLQSLELI